MLNAHPSELWQYPIMTFMHQSVKEDENGNFILPEYQKERLELLMRETAKYCYAKWLLHRAAINLKDPIYKVVEKIYHDDGSYNDIGSIYKNEQDQAEEVRLKERLDTDDLGRGDKGLCLIAAVLNENQTECIPTDYEIEHIRPKRKWDPQHPDDWSEEDHDIYVKKLGNLVPLESVRNKRASNWCFSEKKKTYEESKIAEVRELFQLPHWTSEECRARQAKIVARLRDFFSKDSKLDMTRPHY